MSKPRVGGAYVVFILYNVISKSLGLFWILK
jgi:hypothetical protein